MTKAPPLHCVYRLYDADGRLIYIGATSQPIQRVEIHRRLSWWFKLATRIEPEWHPTREAAFAAEAVAIQEEQPAFNFAATGRGPEDFGHLTGADLETYREWRRKGGAGRVPMYLHNYVFAIDEARAAS